MDSLLLLLGAFLIIARCLFFPLHLEDLDKEIESLPFQNSGCLMTKGFVTYLLIGEE